MDAKSQQQWVIAIIDDNPDDRALVKYELTHHLSQYVFSYLEITNNDELDTVLETGSFNLAITDYQLRWNDGITILKALKNRFPEKPVIMFTGTGNEEVAVDAMKLHLDDYVVKSAKNVSRLGLSVQQLLTHIHQQQVITEVTARYQSLFNQVPIGLFRLSETHQLIEANRLWSSYLNILH